MKIAFLFLFAGLAMAQQSVFDVVSVKLCRDGIGPTSQIASAGHLQLPCFPVARIIAFAYGDTVDGKWNFFPANAISGGPSWIMPSMPAGDQYTIDARTTSNVGHDELAGPLLRQLLADRFKLVVRHESRQMPIYALTVDKRAAKLKPFDGSCAVAEDAVTDVKPFCEQKFQNTADRAVVDIRGITLAAFVRWLNQHQGATSLNKPIADHTGLGGPYDVHLEYRREIPGVGGETEPGITGALREQLGLKLEETSGPRESLVIEHVERPSDN